MGLSVAPTASDGPGPARGTAHALRLGFFGAFHPMTDRAGSASTGMVLMLDRSPRLAHLVVFGPEGARPLEGIDLPRTEVVPAWAVDDVPSLLRALRAMAHRAPELDGYLFSIYPTFFGRSPMANGVGLLLPVLLRRLTGRPVVVFMHNFVESQDVKTLGYDVSPLTLRAAHWLERRLGRATVLAAGLASMADTARSALGVDVTFVPVRFMESVPGLLSPSARTPRETSSTARRGPIRVLFFGTWGPQKDLEGALRALRPLADGATPVAVTIAGGSNPNFPEFGRLLDRLAQELPPATYRFRGHVAESEVPTLFRTHDVLVLPYRTTGGYSGVMNVAGAFGIPVVAYDTPQLRECARLVEVPARFVRDGDGEALRSAVREAADSPAGAEGVARRLADARAGAERLLDLFGPGNGAAPAP